MKTDVLEDLGLTRTEVRVYLALLEFGSGSAGKILEKSGLPNSTVHRDLNSLIEKGVVGFVFEGKKKIYTASEPEAFYSLMEDRRLKFDEILPELKLKQQSSRESEKAVIFRGKRGIQEVYYKMINSKGDEYLTFGGGPITAEVMGLTWWLNLHIKRISNKLSSRQIFDLSVKNIGGSDMGKRKLTNIRYVNKNFAGFQETVIVGDKVAIAVFGENPYAFLIEDEKVAEGYKKYFEELWKLAK